MTTKKVQRGLLYRADGRVFLLKPENGKKFESPELSEAVGGLIEGIRQTKSKVDLTTGHIQSTPGSTDNPVANVTQVWANEEGLLESLPPNPFTPIFANMEIYRLNNYPSYWRVSGDVIAIYNVPVDRIGETESERVTVKQAKETGRCF